MFFKLTQHIILNTLCLILFYIILLLFVVIMILLFRLTYINFLYTCIIFLTFFLLHLLFPNHFMIGQREIFTPNETIFKKKSNDISVCCVCCDLLFYSDLFFDLNCFIPKKKHFSSKFFI